MAFIFVGPVGVGSMYDVTMGVGPDTDGFYQRDDIMLVQYLLKKVWEKHANDINPPLPQPPNSTIAVDGIFGPITANWILQYQQAVNAQGKTELVADGRVDRGTFGATPVHVDSYTIAQLNFMFSAVDSATFCDPRQDPDCPQDLISALSNNALPDGTMNGCFPLQPLTSSYSSGSAGGGAGGS
jgi:hypothetical protein